MKNITIIKYTDRVGNYNLKRKTRLCNRNKTEKKKKRVRCLHSNKNKNVKQSYHYCFSFVQSSDIYANIDLIARAMNGTC